MVTWKFCYILHSLRDLKAFCSCFIWHNIVFPGGRKTQVVDEKGVPYVTEKSSMDFNSVPSAFTAFKAQFVY